MARQPTDTPPPALELTGDDASLMNRVLDFYRVASTASQEALGFLERRRLTHPDLARHFGIGFSDRTLPLHLPDRNHKAGIKIRERLQRLGLVRPTGHEHFRGSIVVPIRDDHGNVVQVYGRKVTGNLRSGTELHTWLPGQRRGVFNPQGLNGDTVIVTGSIIDALTLWCQGHRDVVSIMGRDGPIDGVVAALRGRLEGKVILAFPRTSGGRDIADRLVSGVDGSDLFEVVLSDNMDVNDLALASEDPEDAIATALRHARWIGRPTTRQATPIRTATPELGSPPAAPDAPLSDDGDQIHVVFGDRRWRIRGLGQDGSPDSMRVNVMLSREGIGFHVDVFDMYSSRHRAGFVKQAGIELGIEDKVIKADLGRVLLHLEEVRDAQRKGKDTNRPAVVKLDPEQEREALAFLQDPGLLDRIAQDFDECGVVGEETNKLVAYLAAVSRKLDQPLAVLIQSPSAAGKTSLLDAVLAFVPKEDRATYSAMTGQSLFYVGDAGLKHKVLAIVEQEGAERAAYALKLLQSEGALTIASTSKDAGTGRLVTRDYRVEGPVALMLTTSGIDVDPELSNRCIVLSVDEGREQTRQIHDRQRHAQTLAGMLARQERDRILTLHRNAQRLLRPLMVVNPHAPELTFADHQIRTRRDHQKYLTLIRAVTLLHQHQRPVKTVEHQGKTNEYIESTQDDVALANRLAHEVLGRSLDELPPQTRKVLEMLHGIVTQDCERLGMGQSDCRFTRRQMRDRIGCGNTQLRLHLLRLVDMEYVIPHRSAGAVHYELAWDGAGLDGKPFVVGLQDVPATPRWDTAEATSPPIRPLVGPLSGGCRPPGLGQIQPELPASSTPGTQGYGNTHRGSGKS